MTTETRAREPLSVNAETYWRDICLNLDYQERLYREALGCTRMQVLELEGDYATGQRRRLRFEKHVDAPGPIRRLLPDVVPLEELSVFDAELGRWSFNITAPSVFDTLETSGVVTLAPCAMGVIHCSVNRVTCTMFGVGGILERFVSKSTVEGCAAKAAFTRRYIAERGLGVAPRAGAPSPP